MIFWLIFWKVFWFNSDCSLRPSFRTWLFLWFWFNSEIWFEFSQIFINLLHLAIDRARWLRYFLLVIWWFHCFSESLLDSGHHWASINSRIAREVVTVHREHIIVFWLVRWAFQTCEWDFGRHWNTIELIVNWLFKIVILAFDFLNIYFFGGFLTLRFGILFEWILSSLNFLNFNFFRNFWFHFYQVLWWDSGKVIGFSNVSALFLFQKVVICVLIFTAFSFRLLRWAWIGVVTDLSLNSFIFIFGFLANKVCLLLSRHLLEHWGSSNLIWKTRVRFFAHRHWQRKIGFVVHWILILFKFIWGDLLVVDLVNRNFLIRRF